MACTGKVNSFRIIGVRSIEEGCVSVSVIHGEPFVFADMYREIWPSVFTFTW